MDIDKYFQPSSGSSTRFNVVVFMLLLWTLSQLLIPIKYLPYDVVFNSDHLKMIIPVTGISVSILLYINRLKLNDNFWPFAAFNILVLIYTSVKFIFGEPALGVFQESVKYIIWSAAIFLLFPSVFNSLHKVKIFLRFSISLIVIFLCFTALIILYLDIDALYFSEGRLELFYGNPLYLSGIFYSLLCISLISRELSNSILERAFLLIVVMLSIWAIYMANARTFMLATLVIYLVYFFNIGGNLKKILYFAFFILLLLVFTYIVFLENIDLNKLSSNRLEIWMRVMNNKIDYVQFLIGNYSDTGYIKNIVLEQGASVRQSYQRFSSDNAYIEIFINTGAIGLFLFVLGLKKLFPIGMIKELKKIDRGGRMIRILSLTYGVLISLIVTGFFYGGFPSIGNTMNSIVFPITVSIILLLKRHVIEIRGMK